MSNVNLEVLRSCELFHLPPYSADLNPLEEDPSKIERFLWESRARTRDALVNAMGKALDAVTDRDTRKAFSPTATTAYWSNKYESCYRLAKLTYSNTTVRLPSTRTRSSRCHRTARASTRRSISRPWRTRSSTVSRCVTWATSW